MDREKGRGDGMPVDGRSLRNGAGLLPRLVVIKDRLTAEAVALGLEARFRADSMKLDAILPVTVLTEGHNGVRAAATQMGPSRRKGPGPAGLDR